MSLPVRKRFDRRALHLAAPPVELWPMVDPSHLPVNEQRQVSSLCNALWEFFSDIDTPVTKILRC
jgi:hypothetical protein